VKSVRAVSAALRGVLLGVGVRFAFIYFDVDPDVAICRIADRPESKRSFGRRNGVVAKLSLVTYQRHLGGLLDFAQEVTGAPRYRVDGALPASEICTQVVEFIEAVREPRPEGALP
jgi:hypothetical protein